MSCQCRHHSERHTLAFGVGPSRLLSFSFWFSWELGGSIASLLGTGVVIFLVRAGLLLSWRELVLAREVSFRHGDEAGSPELAAGVELEAGDEAMVDFAKKPSMLFCCLPVEEAELALLTKVGGFAGVFAAMMSSWGPARGR